MLADETKAEIPAWNERKLAQWQEFAPKVSKSDDGATIVEGIEGLQLARFGEGKSIFMLTCSTPHFYESIVFGQLAQIHRVPKNPKRAATKASDWRDASEDEKPRHKKRIDLSDGEIDQVLGLWTKEQSALGLDFVASVWRKDGKEYVR